MRSDGEHKKGDEEKEKLILIKRELQQIREIIT
jgi:hypothetical protein